MQWHPCHSWQESAARMIEDMSIVIAAVVLTALVYLLHRDSAATAADPYREVLVDRDAQRVRADLLAGADRLTSPRRRAVLDVDDWEPRA